ncbi:hypothetical protein Tco_0547550 [Tanacetum coccineum]
MIKYPFNGEEEYVVVKEDEYDDLTITSEEACRAYQEIFRMMDEGWMVTRTEFLNTACSSLWIRRIDLLTLEAKKYRQILVENLSIWKT